MHISAVGIENFRSFERVDLRELPSAMVLLGENNVGKSNFLHAVRLVLDPTLPDSMRTLNTDDFWIGCKKPLGGDVVQVVVELSGFDTDARVKAALVDSCVSDQPLTARLTYVFRPAGSGDGADGDYEFSIYGGADEQNELRGARRREVALTVLPALRDAEADLRHPYRSPLAGLLRLVDVDAELLKGVSDGIKELNESLLEVESLKGLEAKLGEQLESMVGGTHGIEIGLGVSSAAPGQALRVLQLLVEGGFPVSRTGLGASNVLYLALLLVQRDKQRDRNLVADSILAVEEPEAHLHPHVQRSLFSSLMANTSVIVTTHSPSIASVAPLASIVMLREASGPEGVRSELRRAVSSEMSAQQRDDLERYLDVRRADILFARGVVLVEGAAEQFVVPAVAQSIGLDLDVLGITVCSVEGADFVPYRLLLAALEIPHVVITDGDLDKAGRLVGLKRGARLLSAAEVEGALKLYDDEDDNELRSLLADAGIFVNHSTLEVEYAIASPETLQAAYGELEPSAFKRAAMVTALEGAGNDDRDLDRKLTGRIGSLGKGRFAQRLASHLETAEHPDYLVDALEHLKSLMAE